MATSLEQMVAAQDVQSVLACYRDRPEAEVLLAADALREADAYHAAMEMYEWLLGRQESAAAHFGIGQCHGKVYDYATAAVHLGKAFELDRTRSAGASYYAYVLERLGRLEEAAPWYERALAGADAQDLWARSHYAWFLEKCDRPEAAESAYQDVLSRNPAYTWAVKRYALMLRRLGRREQAEEAVTGAVTRQPTSPFARLNLLEYFLLDEDPRYEQLRSELASSTEPPWLPVMLGLFDLYRDNLLPNRPDPDSVRRWESVADQLTDSVHRDFDDLTALLVARGGDDQTWKRLIQRLLR